jgi:hypothetical protein
MASPSCCPTDAKMALPTSEEELTEIPASEIMDKIQKGEHVRYDHVRITGNLDLGMLNSSYKIC